MALATTAINETENDTDMENTQREESLRELRHDIETMLQALTTVDETVYADLMWDGEVSSLSVNKIKQASMIIDHAVEKTNAQRNVTVQIRNVLLLMCISGMKMRYRLFARVYNRFYKQSPRVSGYYEKFVKLLECIELLLETPDAVDFNKVETPHHELSAVEAEIDKVLNARLTAYIEPVDMMIHLLTTDTQFMQFASKKVNKSVQRQSLALLKTTRRTRKYYLELFLERLSECHASIDSLTDDLKNVRQDKQQATRALNKELKSTREVVVKLQKSDPLSELLGIDVNSDTDKRIAELSLKLENVEAKNLDLQRENIRLMKKLSSFEFSEAKD